MKNDYRKILGSDDKPDIGLRHQSPVDSLHLNLSMDDTRVREIEDKVSEWLTTDEEDQIMLSFGTSLSFIKSTIMVRETSNSWKLYNIATSGNWSRAISSEMICGISDNGHVKNKKIIQLKVPNEILSENYNRKKSFTNRLKSKVKSRKNYENKQRNNKRNH